MTGARRTADSRIPHEEWEPRPGRSPAGNLRALVAATNGTLDRRDYVDLARREIPGASGAMADPALDRILGASERTLPTPDADVQALADDIEQALRTREVPRDHIVVRPERRQRVVTVHLTSQTTPGDLNAVWECIGDGAGVDYQQKANRWQIDVDAFRSHGRESP